VDVVAIAWCPAHMSVAVVAIQVFAAVEIVATPVANEFRSTG